MVSGKSGFNEADNSPVSRESGDQMIHFKTSDASDGTREPKHRPTAEQLDRTVHDGQVNYFREVYVNENAAADWRKKIGTNLAKDLGLDTRKVWYLSGWPKNYVLYVQCKGPKDAPRMDLYLFGNGQRFRSANEFYPHARWLLLDDPHLKCECKYCGHIKSQRQINFREGLSGVAEALEANKQHRFSTPTGPLASSSRTHLRRAATELHRMPPSDKFLPVSRKLENDLRSNRTFRVGEVVWVYLDPPIVSMDSSVDQRIEYWPAVIQDSKFITTVEPYLPSQPFNVHQTTVYRILMLATNSQYRLPESQILPYLAYVAPDSVINRSSSIFITALDVDQFGPFAPLPNPLRVSPPSYNDERLTQPPIEPTFQNALVPFLIAVHIARHASSCWCATDPWDFVSEPSPEHPSIIKQDRFQGVWWGPERLWVGDLVRIKPPRAYLNGNLMPWSEGAEERGILLKIMAIYLEPVEGEGETMWKPKIAGTLYELAPDTWQDRGTLFPSSNSILPLYDPTHTPLPLPPAGYQFRAITPSPEYDAHLDLGVLAGRYYPTILSSPILLSSSKVATFTPHSGSIALVPTFSPSVMALNALVPGIVNAIEAQFWKEGKIAMLESGKEEAFNKLGVAMPLAAPVMGIGKGLVSREASFDSLFDARLGDSEGDFIMAD